MKKALVIIAAILVMVAIAGCSNATTSTMSPMVPPAATTVATKPSTSSTIYEDESDHYDGYDDDDHNFDPVIAEPSTSSTIYEDESDHYDGYDDDEMTTTPSSVATTTTATNTENLEYYFSIFREQKDFLENSIRRGQYKAFKAHDLSKYGLREFKPWGWTDNYGHRYRWPVLVDEGTFDECLLIESEEGDLIKFTYRSQMLRRMNLGHLYD